MSPRAVLINDTATRYHHGCSAVMAALTSGLEARGVTVAARVPARLDWRKDAALQAQMKAADLIVVNGEGTLHHGAEAGEALLSVAGHEAARGARLALVNALYHANPAEWATHLAGFELLAARDSASAAEMSATARCLPDLSLTTPPPEARARQGVLVGDAVRLSQRQVLTGLFDVYPGATFLPTKTLRHPIFQRPGLARLSRAAIFRPYMGRFLRRVPRFEMPTTLSGYLEALAGAELHVTGRFHGVCLSLVTRTPFLAVTSTSGKIEKLLSDLGLGTGRIIAEGDIARLSHDPATYAFSADELATIDAALADAGARAATLFDDLAALARGAS